MLRQASDDIRVPDAMDDGNYPEIARSPEEHAKDQTNREDGREHRDRDRAARPEVIPVERPKGIENVRDENAGDRTPAAHQLGLHHPAIHDLLIKPEEKIGNKSVPNDGKRRRLRPNEPQFGGEEERENNVRQDEELNEIGFFNRSPFAPPIEPDLPEPQSCHETNQQQRANQEEKNE